MTAVVSRLLVASTVLLVAAVAIVGFVLARRAGERSARKARGEADLPAAASPEAGASAAADEVAATVREMNERTARNTLTNLALRQAEIRVQRRIDTDGDGRGEYAGFVEMAGRVSGRRPTPFDPPVLSSDYAALDANGELLRAGYRFRVFLPARSGGAVGEPRTGFDRDLVDPDRAAHAWSAYAWPDRLRATGDRSFFVDQRGVLLSSDGRWSGAGRGPPADAATGVDAAAWRDAR